MTHIGKCTKCRGPVTVVTPCVVEAFAGEARPVRARLCDLCIDGMKVAVVTKLEVERSIESIEITQVFV